MERVNYKSILDQFEEILGGVIPEEVLSKNVNQNATGGSAFESEFTPLNSTGGIFLGPSIMLGMGNFVNKKDVQTQTRHKIHVCVLVVVKYPSLVSHGRGRSRRGKKEI